MSDLGELASAHRVPEVTTYIEALAEVPMGQVQYVGGWDFTIEDATYLPVQPNVNDWLLVIGVGLDDAYAYADVEGISLPTIANQFGSVTLAAVENITGPCILHPSARMRLWGFVYRGLGFNETAELYMEPFAWDAGQTLLSATQGTLSYNASVAMAGYSSQVAHVVVGNAKPPYLEFNVSNVPNRWWTEDISATGNPGIDPAHSVRVIFASGYQPSPIPQTQVWVNSSPPYDGAWGDAQLYTAVLPTKQVPLLDADSGNSAPAGVARQPIFTKPT